jgi:hypothetical protein
METLLMIVTIVALSLGVGMSAIAWRLLRENRLRSAARVEVLQELASAPDTDEPESSPPPVRPIHAPARFTDIEEPSEERRDWDMPLRPQKPAAAVLAVEHRQQDVHAAIFAAEAPISGVRGRRSLALAAVAVVMAALVAGIYTIYRPVLAAEGPQSESRTAAGGARGAARPMELLSLKHGMDPTGTFTVTGLVQNPLDGAPLRKVVAVVLLFDREGNYFASGTAPLDFTLLEPGEESPFVVHVPVVSRVSRYRVGFRSEDGGTVVHVDRRGQLPDGTTGGAVSGPAGQRPMVVGKSES